MTFEQLFAYCLEPWGLSGWDLGHDTTSWLTLADNVQEREGPGWWDLGEFVRLAAREIAEFREQAISGGLRTVAFPRSSRRDRLATRDAPLAAPEGEVCVYAYQADAAPAVSMRRTGLVKDFHFARKSSPVEPRHTSGNAGSKGAGGGFCLFADTDGTRWRTGVYLRSSEPAVRDPRNSPHFSYHATRLAWLMFAHPAVHGHPEKTWLTGEAGGGTIYVSTEYEKAQDLIWDTVYTQGFAAVSGVLANSESKRITILTRPD